MKKEIIVAFDCGLDYVEGNEANYKIINLNHKKYLEKSKVSFKDIINNGIRFKNLNNWSRSPELYTEIYREGNENYKLYCNDYISLCKNADIIIQTGGIDIIPFQILDKEFKNTKKVLYFVDDPHATFALGTPYAFAYDYAVYTSDLFDNQMEMHTFLERIGFKNDKIYKLPLCFTNKPEFKLNFNSPDDLLKKQGCVYIGGYYGSKAKRLYEVAKGVGGKDFKIYGNYPLLGYAALLRLLSREMAFTGRVRKVSNVEREYIYMKSAVGFNLHQSQNPTIESGNARTYELPFRGLAQVLDRPQLTNSCLPFKDEVEAMYYDNISDSIEKIRWLLSHPNERAQIAFNGFLKARENFVWHSVVANILDKIYLS